MFAKRPVVATSLSALDSPDDPDGVSFRGTLTHAPAGTADVLVAIGYWCRVGTLDVEKIRGRTAVVSATADDIDWPDSETSVSASPRVVSWDSADTQSSANWTTVEDLSWTQMDWKDCCYDVVLPENVARTAKYLRITNLSMGHAREFEVRTLKKGGLLILVK